MAADLTTRSQMIGSGTGSVQGAGVYGIADSDPAQAQANSAEFYAELRAQFPWIDALGFDPAWVQNLIAQASGPAEIADTIRQTPQYKKRFPGLFRANGEQRMSEAEYFQREDDYRTLMRQYGLPTSGDPTEVSDWFNGDVDPNELKDRLDVWQGVKQMMQPAKDAFYVYAGMRLSDDDLYRAAVDPGYKTDLTHFFDQQTTQSPIDYATFIQRSTELGLDQVKLKLQELQSQGVLAYNATASIRTIDPSFARSVMDQLYTGGHPGSPTLGLQELLQAFSFAAIGGAAKEAGLEMPTLEKLQEIRQAGIDQAKAISTYTQFGPNANLYNAAVQRARGEKFTQSDFESAAFFGNADAQRALQQGLASEQSAGLESGTFRFDQRQSGSIMQRGFLRRR